LTLFAAARSLVISAPPTTAVAALPPLVFRFPPIFCTQRAVGFWCQTTLFFTKQFIEDAVETGLPTPECK
jgi:hypothetical protein